MCKQIDNLKNNNATVDMKTNIDIDLDIRFKAKNLSFRFKSLTSLTNTFY